VTILFLLLVEFGLFVDMSFLGICIFDVFEDYRLAIFQHCSSVWVCLLFPSN
jgi:hypothetical protein